MVDMWQLKVDPSLVESTYYLVPIHAHLSIKQYNFFFVITIKIHTVLVHYNIYETRFSPITIMV